MPQLVIVRNKASSQNLVESTKLERVKLDSKSERRRGKDEKKEKRKHKKEKSSKRVHKKEESSLKKVSDESEQLEKSGLTDELEQPQNHLGYLSDGSQNSKKRKRYESPPAVESRIKAAPVAGKPLRIRLIFKRPKVDESPSLPKEAPCVPTTSGAESLKNREKVVQACSVPVPVQACSVPVPVQACSVPVPSPKVSEPEVIPSLPSTSAVAETKKQKKHRPSKEDKYNALFDNWDPPSISLPSLVFDSKDDGEDWLFGKRTQVNLNSRAAVQDVNTSLQNKAGEASCWPRAQYLPEVGIFSLPYTVPF